jgi:hypothetical protein
MDLGASSPEGEPMGQLYTAVVDFLTEDNWDFRVAEEDVALQFGFRGKSSSWQCLCIVDEEKSFVRFYSILPAVVPEAQRNAVAEFITRANYGLPIGNFELDYGDGEVRYKTSIDIEGGEFTPKMVENLLMSNLTTTDRYVPGLMRVLYGDREPADAIAEIEANEGEDDDDEIDFGSADEDEENP